MILANTKPERRGDVVTQVAVGRGPKTKEGTPIDVLTARSTGYRRRPHRLSPYRRYRVPELPNSSIPF
jgi:hypothetical protein